MRNKKCQACWHGKTAAFRAWPKTSLPRVCRPELRKYMDLQWHCMLCRVVKLTRLANSIMTKTSHHPSNAAARQSQPNFSYEKHMLASRGLMGVETRAKGRDYTRWLPARPLSILHFICRTLVADKQLL